MAIQGADARAEPPRQLGRSIGAILLGFVIVVALSLGTDQIMHVLGIYPPWNQPMNDTGDNALALSYRIVYAVLGSYVAARLAPRNPMRHAIILGIIGFILSTAGAIAAIQMQMGPGWYPILLALTALPSAWLGGALYRRQRERGTTGQ
jgi:MFS family permease